MKKRSIARCAALLLSALLLIAVAAVIYAATSDGEELYEAGLDTPVSNTDNAFFTVCTEGSHNGVRLTSDYGSETMTVSIIGNDIDKFIIDLNGHTLRLGYLAVNIDLEIRGEGRLISKNGIVIYEGDLLIRDGVKVETDSRVAVTDMGAETRIYIGESATITAADGAIAEIAVSAPHRLAAVVFEGDNIRKGSLVEGAQAGIDYFRVAFGDASGGLQPISAARVAEFATETAAEEAASLGVVAVVNPLDMGDENDDGDDSYVRVIGTRIVVGKTGAMLSHTTVGLAGMMSINFYFDLSGMDGELFGLGNLKYSGVGDGGSIEIPDEPEENGKYKFTVAILPTEMEKTVTVWFEGEKDKVWEYSVVRYAKYILDSEGEGFTTELKDTIAAMLYYGAAAQRFCGETEGFVDQLLNQYPEYSDKAVISQKISRATVIMQDYGYDDISQYYVYGKEGSPIAFCGYKMVIGDTTDLKVYLADGYSSDEKYSYHVTYSYKASSDSVYEHTYEVDAESVRENGCVRISAIAASDFNSIYRVTVTDEELGLVIASCDVTVLSYASKLYDGSADGSLERALAEAIIWYGVASGEYFG